jgi:hypothetical protein
VHQTKLDQVQNMKGHNVKNIRRVSTIDSKELFSACAFTHMQYIIANLKIMVLLSVDEAM